MSCIHTRGGGVLIVFGKLELLQLIESVLFKTPHIKQSSIIKTEDNREGQEKPRLRDSLSGGCVLVCRD